MDSSITNLIDLLVIIHKENMTGSIKENRYVLRDRIN